MKNKITPGPWTTFSYPDHVAVVFRPENPRRSGTICDLTGIGGEHDANARLIAAAPELLEACRALARLGIEKCPRCEGTGIREKLAVNEACGQCGGTGEETFNPHPDDIRAARSVVAQAEGQ